MEKVHIILLNWNGWEDTIQCLESVLRSHYPHIRVIVCDNQSTDGSMEKFKDWAEGRLTTGKAIHEELESLISSPIEKPLSYILYNQTEAEQGGEKDDENIPLVLIQNDSNSGYSAGNNVGIKYALQKNADYIWVLNNDTVVAADTLKELVYRMQSDHKLGLVGAVIYHASQPANIQAYGGGKIGTVFGVDRFLHGPGAIDYVSGTSLFIKRKVIEQIGLLDEKFFFYWEDVDFSRRALKKGWKLGVASNAVVYHKFSASVGGQSLKSDLFKAASLTRYFRKHQKIRWIIPVKVNILGMVVKRLFRGQFDRVWPIVKETWRAVRSK
ncbi:MAG: glycosyltransferase family 2 protein [Candidatus Aminicenantes bacterium]|nr:MAG: glycosyltransferase family 2 protein [Candidatus Aminicenantes bacterium]